jgi:AraC-like DNA-binding protein
MTTATDTFAAYVDVLARTLDDHEATGEALAARLHLSRFHFDRVVSAAAGEPPATLRRRILLERAAYRLATGDDDVLRVALDAGYSSHEAFTRAFRRAYGETPSQWRREPGRFELAAPNAIHFNPPGGLRIPADRKVDGMDLLVRMVEHHVWFIGELLDRAGRVSTDVLDAPIELSVEGIDDHPTLRSLLSRLVGQLEMWDASVHNRPYDFDVEVDECLGSMRKRLAAAGPAFLADVRAVADEGRIDETFVDATCDPPETFTYGGMIAHVLTFGPHRRTLVSGALYSAGITDVDANDPLRRVGEAA